MATDLKSDAALGARGGCLQLRAPAGGVPPKTARPVKSGGVPRTVFLRCHATLADKKNRGSLFGWPGVRGRLPL